MIAEDLWLYVARILRDHWGRLVREAVITLVAESGRGLLPAGWLSSLSSRW
jgi:hypothetical protein